MSEPGRGDNTTWTIASRRGWRKSIRRMLGNIEPKHVSKLEALRQSVAGSERLGAGQRFGAVGIEAERPTSSADTSNGQRYGQPAEAGGE
jgi:hypothetical protein